MKTYPIQAASRLWPESTVVCIASGPSLTKQDVEFCRGRARVIVVNDNYRLAPWADVLYAADAAWWKQHPDAQNFVGLKFGILGSDRGVPAVVTVLKATGTTGLELQPTGLKTGQNSGYQAVNLAVHFGARTIVLLGYDMQNTQGKAHWFGKHNGLRNTTPELYKKCVAHYATLVHPLLALGISVVNCSRETALTCFPRVDLATVLGREQAVA